MTKRIAIARHALPRKTIEVADPGEGWFSELIEARQRVRSLVVHYDPQQANWSFGSNPPPRNEYPDRILALALMGVHDTLERAISGHIATLAEQEVSLAP